MSAGLLGLDLPAEFDGGGGDFGFEAVVQQELTFAQDLAFGFAVHSTIVAHYISEYGNVEQKKRWLPKIVSGDAVLAIAMTEPGTGSDSQSVRTTAIRNGDRVRHQRVEDLHFQRDSLRSSDSPEAHRCCAAHRAATVVFPA